ncbi:MAG: helix-turn-helix domain-containing protein [Treponema sp.]|jgi:predicted transcriptional regulator|nr:helix-turn-helix domain-containing protein [Treponema sp.]
MKNRINLDLYQSEKSAAVFRALSSPVRLEMVRLLVDRSAGMNISELAEEFSIPLSSAALHVRILEGAGIIFTEGRPGLRGAQKICALLAEDVYLNIYHRKKKEGTARNVTFKMPLGNYFDCSVTKPCGLAGRKTYIGIEDMENAFYSVNRIHAQLVWFTTGFLEYRFSNRFPRSEKILELGFSFEACSEAPGHNNDWPSDITVWINRNEVFTFRSAGDFGDRRGICNPSWWPGDSTQYGELHRLEITPRGCFGDGRKTSDLDLESLRVNEGNCISFRIGVKEDAEYAGGINLFGECFGNYPQTLEMTASLER